MLVSEMLGMTLGTGEVKMTGNSRFMILVSGSLQGIHLWAGKAGRIAYAILNVLCFSFFSFLISLTLYLLSFAFFFLSANLLYLTFMS